MLFIAMPESHNKTITLIANIGDREHTYICYSHWVGYDTLYCETLFYTVIFYSVLNYNVKHYQYITVVGFL